MGKLTFLTTSFTLLLFTSLAFATGPALTDAQIRSYMDSMQEVEPLLERFDDFPPDQGLVDPSDPETMKNMMSSAVDAMRGHAAYGDMQNLVRRHGFSDLSEWAGIGDRVMRAFISLEMEGQSAHYDEEFQQALREIDSNPHISEEQREMMRQMLGGAAGMLEAAGNAPAADISAVRPHLDELRSIME